MHQPDPWAGLARPTPSWFQDARLGIFVHWGPYAVPAWAEATGELGSMPDETFFAHNPYAEWYWNSLRIPGSRTAERHARLYAGGTYDDFLGQWRAERFEPDELVSLAARAGARYLVLTTKHHDGVTLWDAPGTGSRNTVHAGPGRDLVGELAIATRAGGLRFGAYYSGGLDWHYAAHPPIRRQRDMVDLRPVDPGYAEYAFGHVADLIHRYRPDILWNDIDWPEAGKLEGPFGLPALFADYRDAVPDGVINDRWGVPFHDFRTSEYQANLELESEGVWEHCRGIGYSFGYNQAEGAAESMTPDDAIRLLVDVVSRGGRLLLNVGPRADGLLPDLQRAVLEGMAAWMSTSSEAIDGATAMADPSRYASDRPWVRWTTTADAVYAIAEPVGGEASLAAVPPEADEAGPTVAGERVTCIRSEPSLIVRLPLDAGRPGPAVVRFPRRRGASESGT